MKGRGRALDLPLLLLAAPGVALIAIPLLGLFWRAPWSRMAALVVSPAAAGALRLSLICSVSATLLSLAAGLPLAWLLARSELPGRSLLRTLTTLPMVLPPVVGGVALLLAFGRAGLLGGALAGLGVRLPFTTAAVIVAETFVAMPFMVITLEAGLRSLDGRLEEAARTLGARRWRVLTRVTLPLVAPSIGAGVVLAWSRALGEFGATITFAGNLPGVTQTLPLAVYLDLQTDPDAAIMLSLVLVAVSMVVLLGLRRRWLGAG